MNLESRLTVSVCMITYNHEAFITQAIEGVLMQQAKFNIRLVIGEDHSKDETREICQKYVEKFPDRITLLPSTRNLGMTSNFINTLSACTGKYIAICEGDDYWTDPHKLQKQINFLESNPSYKVCYTLCDFSIDGPSINDYRNSTFNKIKFPFSYNFSHSIQKKGGATLTMVFTREVLNLSDFELASKECAMADWPLECLITLQGDGCTLIDNTGVYRQTKTGASATSLNVLRYFKSRITFCEYLLNYIKLSLEHENIVKRFLLRCYLQSAITKFHFGYYKEAFKDLRESLSNFSFFNKKEKIQWIKMYTARSIILHFVKILILKILPTKLHDYLPAKLQYALR